MKHLFVYGSLKPGGWAHDRYLNGYVNPGLEASIVGTLYDTGSNYPAVAFDEPYYVSPDLTYGVLYQVEDNRWDELIRSLDFLEGYPVLFDRIEGVPVFSSEGYALPDALVYFGNRDYLFKTRIESGEWVI